jgi:hypothetical protein
MRFNPEELGPFDPNDPHDMACDKERREFGLFIARRMSKAATRHADLAPERQVTAVLAGAFVAAVGAFKASDADTSPMSEDQKDALRTLLEFAFVQADTTEPAGTGRVH